MAGIGFGLLALLAVLTLGVALTRQSVSLVLLVLGVVELAAAVVFGVAAVQLFAAKQRAIAGQPVRLLFGLARLITWEQNEGVLLLRDKRVAERIYGNRTGGGLRLLYPVLGEEVRERVPLAVQLTWFEDSRILTREAVQLSVKVALYWQVHDIEAYSYKIDPEVRSLRDRERPGGGTVALALPAKAARGRLDIANLWVRTLAESCLRKLVSETSTLLIVSKRAALSLPDEVAHPLPTTGQPFSDEPNPATPDVLAERLKADLHPRLTEYGLGIDRVEVQEVQLPPAFQQAVDDVWVAATHPRKGRYEAEAMQTKLTVLCNLLGREAAGMSQIVEKLPAGTYMSNPLAALQGVIAQLSVPTPAAAALPTAVPVPTSPPQPKQDAPPR